MPCDKKRAPRARPGPYNIKGSARGTAPTRKQCRENLPLQDWLEVFQFIDTHPSMAQSNVVKHFATRPNRPLKFDQSTLSRNLKRRNKLEERAHTTPTALKGKRERVVTRPDVEAALVKWFQGMERRGETVSGPMLSEKRRRFEDEFEVPEEERLQGIGWIPSFCKAYGLKEYRRHGEAGSVDIEAVAREQCRVSKITAQYHPRDVWNVDESPFNPYRPPDRGLASKQMSGKKQSKFRITVTFACNSDGSEKSEPFFIGKYAKPRCFLGRDAKSWKIFYRNNRRAWMTAVLFEEFLKKFDAKMRREGRSILLLADNFSGHFCAYQPTNIRLEFFEPNLTSHVQPLDAGIIRCFKAHYRKEFCARAIDLDQTGESDIYQISLIEAIKMAQRAWDAVTPETIINCWRHTQIQGSQDMFPDLLPSPSDLEDRIWTVLYDFAKTADMTLPQAEDKIQAIIGKHKGITIPWKDRLNKVMNAEMDTGIAVQALDELKAKSTRPRLVIRIPAQRVIPQVEENEHELMALVQKLKDRNRVHGETPGLDEIVVGVDETDPEMEEILMDDADIVEAVRRETVAKNGEAVEDDDDSEEEEESPQVNWAEVPQLCAQLEMACLAHLENDISPQLLNHLRKFRGFLRSEETRNAKQTTLDSFFRKS